MQSASGSTVIRSSKCDLSATLEGSAPYIVVFWPSRTNFPRRAGLRQGSNGLLRFSLCFHCQLMDSICLQYFLGRLALLGQTNMKHDIWSRSITCFQLGWNHHLGCVLYKSSSDQASYVNEIDVDWCRVTSLYWFSEWYSVYPHNWRWSPKSYSK